MSGQVVRCPLCRAPLAIHLAPAKGRSLLAEGKAWSYDATARPAFPSSPPMERPFSFGNLSPGERRSSTHYHRWEMGDVMTDLAIALITGTLAGCTSVPMAFAWQWAWHWPPLVWLGTTSLVWVVKVFDFFDNDKAVTRADEMERTVEPVPVVQQVQAPSVALTINEKRERGGGTQDRATLKSPEARAGGLAAYCAALAKGKVFPSWEGGASKPGAQSYGYTEREFNDWRREAVRAKLLSKRPGRNQGYDVTERGITAFERIGRQHLERASYGL